MADISKVKLPGSDTIYDIKDATARSGLANIAYGSCSTAAATAAKTVAATGFTLTTGARVAVKFTVTNTAVNPTLNVNSTGAKAIYYKGAAITKEYLAANKTYEFIYNGTQYDLVGDVDTNTNTNVTTSPTTSGTIYITGKTSNAANNNATEVLNNNVTIDASAGKIKTNATVSTDDNSVVTTKGYVDSLIGESVSGVTGAMHFKGTVTSVPASSSLYLNGSETATTMQEGDVVIYDSKEYVFDGTNWHELGDESHHIPVVTGASGQVPKFTSTGTLASTGYELNKTVPSNAVFTDASVTASANHYTPVTASGQDKTASASGATAAWSIDVVKGVTLNTDGKGHVTGLSVESGKIPANPNTDTSVTSSANHYTPSTVSGQDKSASASGGTAAWSTDVVTGVALNTDGKGHVTGLSVTSGKIPANPNTDTSVTSSANHYTPSTASGGDKTASASGATAAWSIDVVKGVTLNTDGKGHVTGLSVTSGKIPANPNTDTKVTSSANHYTPATVSGNDKTASASGATAAWSIDVVKGVTLNTDGKGHVTGLSVTSGKIPANPNTNTTYTLSGARSGNTWVNTLTPSSGTATTSTVPAMGAASSSAAGTAGLVPAPAAGKQASFLRGDGTWVVPTNTDTKVNMVARGATKSYLLGTTTSPTSSAQAVTSVAETGVYFDTNTAVIGSGGLIIDIDSIGENQRLWSTYSQVKQLLSYTYSGTSNTVKPIIAGVVKESGAAGNTNDGTAVSFGASGLTIVGAGEVAAAMLQRAASNSPTNKFCVPGSTDNADLGSEHLILASDSSIGLYPGYQTISGDIVAKSYFDDNGSFNGPTNYASVITDINPGSHLNVVNNKMVPIYMTNPGGSGKFNMIACANSANGKFYFGAYNTDFKLHYRANSEGTGNNATRIATLMNESGAASFPGNFSVGGNRLILGSGNSVTHDTAFALGESNTVSHYGGALGRGNTLSGENSYALGGWNNVSGEKSVVLGTDNTTYSERIYVLGSNNSLNRIAGNGGYKQASYSVAIGKGNTIEPSGGGSSFEYGCAIGGSNTVRNPGIAIGCNNTINITTTPSAARRDFGFVAGSWSDISQYNAYAVGYGVTNNSNGAFVCGRQNKVLTANTSYNSSTTGDVFAVGNGYSTTDSSSPTGYSHVRGNAFRVTYTGTVYSKGAYNTSGADYAEFVKEWWDGNPGNEDRVGYMVTVKDGKLHKAEAGDYILGITSGNPSVVGNADEDYFWMYERDEFNRPVYEEIPDIAPKLDEDGNPLLDDEGNVIYEDSGTTIRRFKFREDYDPSLQDSYIERKDRPEWDYVGMRGIVPCRDDGTCEVGGFCKCGTDGIATKADTRGFDTYYVLERINDHVISVEVK